MPEQQPMQPPQPMGQETPAAQPEEKKSIGASLFGPKKPEAPAQPQTSSEVIEMGQRLRLIEERFANLRNKVGVMDQNMLNNSREEKKDIQGVNAELDEINRTINDLKDKMKLMIEEIKTMARNEDLQTIKKYLEYWQPVEFVTRKELLDVVKRLKEDRQNI